MNLSTLILDDESKPAQLLAGYIKEYCPEIKLSSTFNKVGDAVKFLNKNPIDLIFLDVEMPEMNGFDLMDILPEEQKPKVIFTTAHTQYAVKAFRFNAVDYLVKPIHPKDLIQAVKKVKILLNKTEMEDTLKISIYDGKQYHIVNSNKLRVEADGSYSKFVLEGGKVLLSSKRLKSYEELLEKNGFTRIHKSHMVNLKQINSYSFADGGCIFLNNGDEIPFSTAKREALLNGLKLSSIS
jgi:two-component system LytT family response regulator